MSYEAFGGSAKRKSEGDKTKHAMTPRVAPADENISSSVAVGVVFLLS